MTRYEIALGIAPPPEPVIEYVMGIDIGVRSETVCCVCHEKDGCMHVDDLLYIPPGRNSLEKCLQINRERYDRRIVKYASDNQFNARERQKARDILWETDVLFSYPCRCANPDVVNCMKERETLAEVLSCARTARQRKIVDVIDAMSIANYILVQRRLISPLELVDEVRYRPINSLEF